MGALTFVVIVLVSSVVMIVAIVTAIIIVVVIAIAITIATIIIVAIARAIIIPFWIVPTILPKMGSLMSNVWVIRPWSALAIVLIVIVIIVSIVAGLLRFFLVINIEKLGHSINGFSGKFLSNFLESLSPWLWHCVKE